MTSILSQCCVVLVEPTLPENVGAVARAMNNMGVKTLRLVNPCDHLSLPALNLAAHSQSILQTASCYERLEDAIADVRFVVGTTARKRERFAEPIDLPRLTGELPALDGPLALVFGRESSGLTNQELACCHQYIRIPTFGDSQSLNLAQAVIVVLYELSRNQGGEISGNSGSLASAGDLTGLKEHLFRVLKAVGFLKEHQHETLWQSFSDLVGRARMGTADVRLIRGFLRRTEIKLRRLGQRGDHE